jgi:hypothetical protein
MLFLLIYILGTNDDVVDEIARSVIVKRIDEV